MSEIGNFANLIKKPVMSDAEEREDGRVRDLEASGRTLMFDSLELSFIADCCTARCSTLRTIR